MAPRSLVSDQKLAHIGDPMTIDKAFYLRQIDAWSSSQPEGTRLTPAEMEQFADHLYGNAAQLLVLEREAKDAAFEEMRTAIETATNLAMRFGGTDEGHHMTWIIAQMVRALTGEAYEEWVRVFNAGEDGPETYEWDEGITP